MKLGHSTTLDELSPIGVLLVDRRSWCQSCQARGFGDAIVRVRAFHLWLCYDNYVKKVSRRSAKKAWVFAGYSGFLLQGKLRGWNGFNPELAL